MGCNDIGNRKSEFVRKIQFICSKILKRKKKRFFDENINSCLDSLVQPLTKCSLNKLFYSGVQVESTVQQEVYRGVNP